MVLDGQLVPEIEMSSHVHGGFAFSRRTVLSALTGLAAGQNRRLAIRGIYSNPKPFWAAGGRLDEYGINAVFVHSGSITPELAARVRSEGARLFAEFPTLNGKGYVEKHPEAWPMNEKGDPSPQATWFMGACPTDPGFRAFRMRQLESLLERFDVAGVWMDYFHWHAQFEDPNPVLPETCFSPSCIAAFEAAAGVRVPGATTAERSRFILTRHEGRWRDWRVSQLLSWAREIGAVVRARRPGALAGVYHCPWTEQEYGGALRRVLGLDLARLADHVDVLSPMVYHGRMHRSPGWVREYVEWLSGRIRKAQIWPIVQAHNDPGRISAAEFEQVLRAGAAGRSTGVMMFTAQSVAEDPEKMNVMRRFYREMQ
jgi:hypothetical protein